jgi:hypothetical protein
MFLYTHMGGLNFIPGLYSLHRMKSKLRLQKKMEITRTL